MKKLIKKSVKNAEIAATEGEQKLAWVKNLEKPLIAHYIENGKILDGPFVFMVLPGDENEKDLEVFPVGLSGKNENDKTIYDTFSEKLKTYITDQKIEKGDGKIIIIHHSHGVEDHVFLITVKDGNSAVTQINL
ncbi:MAG: hypothetical protein ABI388_02820 [Bacteroidia bacterium]